VTYVRHVLAVGIATGLGAGVVAALQSCALPDYELAATTLDATVEGGGGRDAAGDSKKPPSRDSAAGSDARADAKRDAGQDAHRDAAGDVKTTPTGCVGKTYPPPPVGPDVPGVGTFTLAVHSIDLGDTDPVPPGYDLDQTCTCIDDGGPSCASHNQHCDFAAGVDNGAVTLIKAFEATQPTSFGSSAFSSMAASGHWSILLQLSGYGTTPDGGVPDDPSVDLAIFVGPSSITQPPNWDGNDSWLVAASSVGDGGLSHPLYKSGGAYVANHVLVAALPEMEMTLSGGGMQTITVHLTSGFLTGTLDLVGNSLQISDGIIAGRWAEPDIFKAVSSYRTTTGAPLCTNTLIVYAQAKGTICNGLDILTVDGQPASLPCNALSMGVGFTAFPILPLSTVGAPTVPTPGCSAATDPATDSCGDGG